jgi:hypothetical protein
MLDFGPYEPFPEDVTPWLEGSRRRRLRVIGMEMTVGGFTAAAAGAVLTVLGAVAMNSAPQNHTTGSILLGFGIGVAAAGATIGFVGIPILVTASKSPRTYGMLRD